MSMVHISRLYARRSSTFALSIDNIRLQSGEVLCVTGANGSGKTTLIECLAGLLRPDKGSIIIDGHILNSNLRATKALLGFVPDDEEWLIKELCAAEYFKLLENVYHEAGIQVDMRANIENLAGTLHFTALQQQLGTLSHGNKKKVQIIAGLMHRPRVIVIDELRNGLDPIAIMAAEKLIKDESSRGACIVAATHDLWWAERISTKTLLLSDGAIAAHAKTATLIKQHGSLERLFMKTVSGQKSGTL